jgi:uncharacterized DUF497 family protein
MRFKYDRQKSERLRQDPGRRVGFEEAIELWNQVFCIDQRSMSPEQWRAVGWIRGDLYAVIFEERTDEDGDYVHLVTLWRATKQERKIYEENT